MMIDEREEARHSRSPGMLVTGLWASIAALGLLQACTEYKERELWSPAQAKHWPDSSLAQVVQHQAPDAKRYGMASSTSILAHDKTLISVSATYDLAQLHGDILRSADGGRSWTNATAGKILPAFWHAIEHQGVLVAVGDSGQIMRSTDRGVSWVSAAYTGTKGELRHVVKYRSGLAAVGAQGTVILSSDGGDHWEQIPGVVDSQSLLHAAESQGSLIAVGFGGSVIRLTPDGRSRVPATDSGTKRDLWRVVEHQGALVAVGRAGTIIRSTDNGDHWTAVSSGTTSDLWQLVEHRGALVASGSEGAVVLSTDGGNHWIRATSTLKYNLQQLREHRGALVTADGAVGAILRSTDGGDHWVLLEQLDPELGFNRHLVEYGDALLSVTPGGVSARRIDYSSDRRFPTVERVVQSYEGGTPILRITFNDPSQMCQAGSCIAVEGLSKIYHDPARRRAPETFPRPAGRSEISTITVPLDPDFLGARHDEKFFARVVVRAAGHVSAYPGQGRYWEIPNLKEPWWDKPAVQGLALAALLFLSLYSILLVRPLWLLGLTRQAGALEGVSKLGAPALTEFLAGLMRALLLPVLSRHPKVLDAWVRRSLNDLRSGFEGSVEATAGRIGPYFALPVEAENETTLLPSPVSLGRSISGKRTCLQIVAQGGAGKTRLAIEIGRWIFDGQVFSHPAAVIFVDEEFNDLLAVVVEKLGGLLPKEQLPPTDFLQALLSKGRLCVVIDRLSERQATTRQAYGNVYRKMSPKLLISTSRHRIKVDGESPKLWAPLPMNATTLLGFLAEQLRQAQASDLYPNLGDQSALAQHLAQQITLDGREMPMTPLLVKIFVSNAVELARKSGNRAISQLPSSVPETYFSYVERLDHTRQSLATDQDVADRPGLLRIAAALVAYVELGEEFRPKPVPVSDVDKALSTDPRLQPSSAAGYVQRLEKNGLLTRRSIGNVETVDYVLDPLAECLAAFEHALRCGSDEARWQALIHLATKRGESAKGFLLALRLNHAAYANELKFPRVDFPEGADKPVK